MKIFILFFCFSIISNLSYSQKFETDLNISSILTFGSNKTTESKFALGYSVSIQEFFYITKKLAIGTELNYSYDNYKLKREFDGAKIPESDVYYECKLSLQTLNVPLIIKYKTQKNWFFQAGYGLTCLIGSKSKVDFVYSDWFSKNDTRTEITEKSDNLKRDFNSYLNIGTGKGFTIFKIDVIAQVYYEVAFKDYDFRHGGGSNDALYVYKVKPQQIGIKIGIKL